MPKLNGRHDFGWVTNNKRLIRLAIYLSPQTYPNLSLLHLSLIKSRVLFEFTLRTFLLLGIQTKALQRTKKLHGTKRSKKALVLGNGPSVNLLNDSDARKHMQNTDIFVVNFFAISNLVTTILPNYLVLSDPLTHPRANSAKNLRLWAWIESNPSVTLVVPTSWHGIINELRLVERSIFFDDRSLVGISRNVSPLRPRGYGSLTSYKALSMACYFGYSSIGILGFDNTMFRNVRTDSENRVLQGSNYFYEEDSSVDISQTLYTGIADYFYDTANAFAYLRLFCNFPILNLDKTSLVDAFPKISNILDF